jgi:hypothetical protein
MSDSENSELLSPPVRLVSANTSVISEEDEEKRRKIAEAYLNGSIPVKDITFGDKLKLEKSAKGVMIFKGKDGSSDIAETSTADGYVYEVQPNSATPPIDQVHKITIPRKDKHGNFIDKDTCFDVIYLNNSNELLDYEPAIPNEGQGVSMSWLQPKIVAMNTRHAAHSSGAQITNDADISAPVKVSKASVDTQITASAVLPNRSEERILEMASYKKSQEEQDKKLFQKFETKKISEAKDIIKNIKKRVPDFEKFRKETPVNSDKVTPPYTPINKSEQSQSRSGP